MHQSTWFYQINQYSFSMKFSVTISQTLFHKMNIVSKCWDINITTMGYVHPILTEMYKTFPHTLQTN